MNERLDFLRRQGIVRFVVELGLLSFAPLFMVGYTITRIIFEGSVTYTLKPYLTDLAIVLAAGVLWALTVWWAVVRRIRE